MANDGYRKMKASDLPPIEQERLRRALQHDLMEAMIRAIRDDPPQVDLGKVEVVLKPHEAVGDFTRHAAADCVTCVTCITCVTS